MRLRNVSIAALVTVGLLAPAQTAGATGNRVADPAPATISVVPETVSKRVEGFDPAPGMRAASADGGDLSSPAEAPIAFSMVGLELPADASGAFRTSDDGRSWGAWHTVEHLDDGPDLGSAEHEAALGDGEFTEPIWVGSAKWIQVEVDGAPLADVAATFIDSNGLSTNEERTVEASSSPVTYQATSARPAIMSRAQWGANESYRRGSPSIASGGAKYAVVHHTAGGNVYSAAEGPAVVRGIYSYHTRTLGWSDVGYNVLVDRHGQVYEGRAGGLDKAIVGAHAQGFNTGSVGISVIGNFERANVPEAAMRSVAEVLSWKFKLHGINPKGTLSVRSAGSNKYPSGRYVSLDTITAHRNVGLSACPGAAFYARMPALRDMVAATSSVPVSLPGGFSDIAGSVHTDNIVKLVERNITSGCEPGRFCPLTNLSRGQAAALLVRALPELRLATGQRYDDVPETHLFAPHIWMATEAGLITGYDDDTFRPWDPVTREQVATMLGRAAKLERRPGQFFNDVAWTSPHLAWVNALGEAGISKGCGGGAYCPGHNVSRQEMASFIVRGLLD